ncbi:MAG: hypothetical protein KKE51_10800 [Gammaproteobacteria bacterium]|nr:hypothetical protein [Gammaproteobacteria bacterium]MBU1602857.1 hypothetical protein [Gammaproteobacteria bacterium]MBU2432529.1 hypothetical protein [Gammaproteobacteria bacterium]MBU2448928.1 hypothetical protein [Gammaproteobacteria bacterium]
MKKLGASLVAAVCLAGCGTSPLIPNETIQLTAKTGISLSSLATVAVVGAAIYLVYDPLAPNWEIEESRLSPDVYRFSMKMKRYHTGGAGESVQILKRRASQLQYENGFASYQILEYTEGIDSQTIGARRMAEGTIRLVQRQEADSYKMNERY